jgi:hypothetical protein
MTVFPRGNMVWTIVPEAAARRRLDADGRSLILREKRPPALFPHRVSPGKHA